MMGVGKLLSVLCRVAGLGLRIEGYLNPKVCNISALNP